MSPFWGPRERGQTKIIIGNFCVVNRLYERGNERPTVALVGPQASLPYEAGHGNSRRQLVFRVRQDARESYVRHGCARSVIPTIPMSPAAPLPTRKSHGTYHGTAIMPMGSAPWQQSHAIAMAVLSRREFVRRGTRLAKRGLSENSGVTSATVAPVSAPSAAAHGSPGAINRIRHISVVFLSQSSTESKHHKKPPPRAWTPPRPEGVSSRTDACEKKAGPTSAPAN